MKSTFRILQQVLQFIEYYVNLQIDKNNNNNNNNNNNILIIIIKLSSRYRKVKVTRI